MATPAQLGDVAVELPRIDVRGLARRAALPAALGAVLGGTLLIGGGPVHTFAHTLGRVAAADPRWIAAAALLEIGSFMGYIVLLWLVGGRATQRIDLRASAQITLGGAAATRLLPTAGVGGAVLTLWALRRTGLSSRAATRTLLSFLVLLYSVFLGTLLVAGGLLALGIAHSDAPRALGAVPATAAAPGDPRRPGDRRRHPRPRATPRRAAAAARRRPARGPPRPRRARGIAVDLGAGVRGALALAAHRRPAAAGRRRLVGAGRRRAVGDAARLRRPSRPRGPRARLRPRPGREHAADPRRRERRDRRRADRLRRRPPAWPSSPCWPTARSRSGSPRRSAWPRSRPLRRTLAAWGGWAPRREATRPPRSRRSPPPSPGRAAGAACARARRGPVKVRLPTLARGSSPRSLVRGAPDLTLRAPRALVRDPPQDHRPELGRRPRSPRRWWGTPSARSRSRASACPGPRPSAPTTCSPSTTRPRTATPTRSSSTRARARSRRRSRGSTPRWRRSAPTARSPRSRARSPRAASSAATGASASPSVTYKGSVDDADTGDLKAVAGRRLHRPLADAPGRARRPGRRGRPLPQQRRPVGGRRHPRRRRGADHHLRLAGRRRDPAAHRRCSPSARRSGAST